MGLTFQQKFYVVPDVYLMFYMEPGDMSSAQTVCGILEAPDEDNYDFLADLEAEGYFVKRAVLDELVVDGLNILREANLYKRYEEIIYEN